METSQHDMTSTLNTMGSLRMKQWQWRCHLINSSTYQEANEQFCNVITPFQPLTNPPSYITALYTRNTCSISTRCSLQIRKTQDVSIPSQLTPNIWILTTPPSAITTAIALICPGETSKFITIQKLIHILWLTQACNATMPTSIYPHIWKFRFGSQHFFGYGKLKHDQHIIYEFSDMATFREASEWESATTLG